jgi:hypothetical protein
MSTDPSPLLPMSVLLQVQVQLLPNTMAALRARARADGVTLDDYAARCLARLWGLW